MLVLVVGAGALGWLVLSRAQRAELEFVLLRANAGPLAVSVGAVVGLGVLLALVVRRKSRFLTTAVEAAHADLAAALGPRERAMVALPQVALSLAGLGLYAFLYVSGVTRWFFLGMLGEPRFAALRGGLVVLTTCGPAVLIPAFVVVLLNGTGITRRLRARVADPGGPELRDRRLPSPGDYQGEGTRPVFLLGARESKESRRFEPDAAVPSWVTFAAPSIFGGMLVFGRKRSRSPSRTR